MNSYILSTNKDPIGKAISDYFLFGKADPIRVFSSQFDEDEMPVEELFRDYKHMPILEQKAIELAHGKVLDVGAGSGCHTLILQDKGLEVCAIDISPLSVQIMKQQGIKDARLANLFQPDFAEHFDTVLMLMNGSGIIGTINNIPTFFQKMKLLLNPGGCILMDSSDLKYLFEDENGEILIDLADDYYGQIDFTMQYKNIKGEPFNWLYIDFETLAYYADCSGFKAEMIYQGEHFNYLAKLTQMP